MTQMTNGDRYDIIAFDADDTLWKCEEEFKQAEELFARLIEPYAPPGVDVKQSLITFEISNVPVSGYGVMAWALSAVQAAITVTGGKVPATVIGELVDHAHEMLVHPVQLLSGVAETLAAVREHHRIAVITKGDLRHQLRKVRMSGIEGLFEHIEVVAEKDSATYEQILRRWDVPADRFLMIGNSVKSDVLPVIEAGGAAIHIEAEMTWAHELVAGHGGGFVELDSISDVPGWLAAPVATTS